MRREIRELLHGQPVTEGAGVRLRRVFGNPEVPRLDPFLMLDDFRSERREDFIKGFPWHPHRGIETITYVLDGDVEHGDSLGNSGVIGAGDVQWMTAGRGILHQEMPRGNAHGAMLGFQLWANLPASHKMMPPRYRDVRAEDIPEAHPGEGCVVKVVAGEVGGVRGPVRDVVIDPGYLDCTLAPGAAFEHAVAHGDTVFAYVIGGALDVDGRSIPDKTLALLGEGDEVVLRASGRGARFLLVSGRPLGEPVAWRGPIVMNTWDEIERAYAQLADGTFVRQS